MTLSHKYLCITFLSLGLAACGGSDDGATEAASALSDGARFDKDFREKSCELLSTELVSNTFGMPADELTQHKIMGCRYSWKHDTETLEAAISMLRAHKSEKSAAEWFGRATKNKTAEEMKAEMEQISRRLEEKEELQTDAMKGVAKGILATVGGKAINFEDVTGVGEEARVNTDGTVYVRVDNLTFLVSGYKGPKEPQLDLTGVELKQMAKVALESADQWALETAQQRRKDGTKLARAINAEL